MCQNENKKFSEIKMKVSQKAKLLATVRNSIVVRKKKTALLDPLSLFHRTCILQEGPDELRSYFKYANWHHTHFHYLMKTACENPIQHSFTTFSRKKKKGI